MRRMLIIVSLALALGFVSSPSNATDITQLQGITGKLGNEDFAWGTGLATDTFDVHSYTSGTVTLTKIPSLASSLESLLKGVWYVSNSALIADHGNATVSGSLAWVVATAGSTDKTKVVLPPGTYPIATAVTIPSNIVLDLTGGAVISGAASMLVLDSPDQILARSDQQAFDCTGTCVTFTKPGTIFTNWWGPPKDGTDAYADLNASIESVPAASTVVLGTGIHTLETGLYVHTGVNIVGNCAAKVADGTYASTLKAGTGATGSLLIYLPGSPYAGQTTISCITLDGNDVGAIGLEIKNSNPPVKVSDAVAFEFTDTGFYVNGWGNGYPDEGFFDNVIFERCWSGLNAVGYKVAREGTGYFGTIDFNNCHGYYNATGVLLKGDNGTTETGFSVRWTGGMLEGGDPAMQATNTTGCTAFRVKNRVSLTVENTYIENYVNYCDSGDIHFWASNNSYVGIHGGKSGLAHWYSKYEDNSTICQETPAWDDSEAYQMYGEAGPVNRYCIGRITDKKTWGPPNFPVATMPSGGWGSYKGAIYTDAYGVRWIQVGDTGTSGTSLVFPGESTQWAPMDGIVIIPFDNETLNAANSLVYWNQVDKFLLTDVDVVVTEAFTHSNTTGCGGTGYFTLGIDDAKSYFVGNSTIQGNVANLTLRNVVSSHDNNSTEAKLDWDTTHKSFLMDGYSPKEMTDNSTWENDRPYSYIGMYPCPYTACITCDGVWTHGSGYIVIRGRNLRDIH